MTLGVGERCSIKGHVRDAIDVNSDVSVTTTRLLYNGTSPTQESKLQDKNNLLHTHTYSFADKRRGDICDAICLILRNNSIMTQMMIMMMMKGGRKEL
jgi:hypothetical protein